MSLPWNICLEDIKLIILLLSLLENKIELNWANEIRNYRMRQRVREKSASRTKFLMWIHLLYKEFNSVVSSPRADLLTISQRPRILQVPENVPKLQTSWLLFDTFITCRVRIEQNKRNRKFTIKALNRTFIII